MKNIAVIFGGNSSEHDISVLTGFQVVNNLDKKKYRIIPIYVTHAGNWFIVNNIKEINNIRNKNNILNKSVFLAKNGDLFVKNKKNSLKLKQKIDICVLAFHGKNGEDGTIQGYLEAQNIPYTSSGVLSSAICMDKYYTKTFLKNFGYSQTEFLVLRKDDIVDYKKIIDYPVVVKPCCLGSSIGISFCKNENELKDAINLAFIFDSKIIIEKAVENLVEYNCAVVKYLNEVVVSEIEQPIKSDDILSFKDKYLTANNKGKSGGMKNLSRIIPAKISKKLENEILETSKNLFKDLDCTGVVRIDYLYDSKLKKLFVNEINSIPGSFAFYLFKGKGLNFSQLLDGVIATAEIEHNNRNILRTKLDSEIKF